MKAVICTQPGELRLIEREPPRRNPDEVLIRVRRVGLCGTDFHIFQGKHPYLTYPRVMGHELSGEVVEAPAASALRAGERVYINPYLSCGKCHACQLQKPNCCMDIAVLGVHCDGGLVEYLTVPQANVFSAGDLSLDDAAMIEFLAIGAHAVGRSELNGNQSVLVVGAGPIGLGTMLFAKLSGADVTAVDLRSQRLDFVATELGIADTVLGGPDCAAELTARTRGNFYDVVFDATGNTTSIETGFDFVAHGGTYVLVSVVKDRITFSDPGFHKREMKLVSSRNALASDFETVRHAFAENKIPSEKMRTHSAPLEELALKMPLWLSPEAGIIKAMVELPGGGA